MSDQDATTLTQDLLQYRRRQGARGHQQPTCAFSYTILISLTASNYNAFAVSRARRMSRNEPLGNGSRVCYRRDEISSRPAHKFRRSAGAGLRGADAWYYQPYGPISD